MGVVVGDETETEALFLAKVFERGQDRSFAELSTFTRALDGEGGVGGALRYAGGTLLPRAALPRGMADGAGLRRDAFLALAATHTRTLCGPDIRPRAEARGSESRGSTRSKPAGRARR